MVWDVREWIVLIEGKAIDPSMWSTKVATPIPTTLHINTTTNRIAAAGVASKVEGLHDALVQKLVTGLQVGPYMHICIYVCLNNVGGGRHARSSPRPGRPLPYPIPLQYTHRCRWRRPTTRPPWTWPRSRRAASRGRSTVRGFCLCGGRSFVGIILMCKLVFLRLLTE